MRITELCENINRELDKPAKDPNDPYDLGFDVKEDLVFFMNHDDQAYRRHTFPAILKTKDILESGKKTDYKLFDKAVKECYNMYQDQFKGHKLPENLDQMLIDEVCQHIHEEECEKIKNGEYKDQ